MILPLATEAEMKNGVAYKKKSTSMGFSIENLKLRGLLTLHKIRSLQLRISLASVNISAVLCNAIPLVGLCYKQTINGKAIL